MKKGLLFLTILSLFGATSYSQLSITVTTNSPRPGDMFVGHESDTTGVVAGPGGAGVLWDFSNLLTNGTDTSGYVACEATPVCDSFPGSTIVNVANNGFSYTYMANTGTRLKALGTYQSESDVVRYTDPNAVLFYPFSYTSNYRDTFCYMPLSGGTDSFICDGFGTLVLPSGLHNNVLRAHITTVYRDTVMIAGIPVISERLGEVYNWYKQGFNYPLLSMTYDTSGTAMPYLSSVKYYVAIPRLAVPVTTLNGTTLQVTPNPATDEFTLTFDLADVNGAVVTISDITGKSVMELTAGQLHAGTNRIAVPANNLPAGMYIARLRTEAGNTTQKLIISK